MIRLDRFRDGKTNAVIFSFDDGTTDDRRLVSILDKYGLRATFHLNSGRLDSKGYVTKDEINGLYKNHEIALHGQDHSWLINCPPAAIIGEILNDRLELEKLTASVLTGFSYAYGNVNDTIYNAAAACGVEYARTVNSTHSFFLPEDFLKWNPTCHMYDAEKNIEKFISRLSESGNPQLLFIWGHSFELERDSRWDEFDSLCRMISGRDEILYTTCGEFFRYRKVVRNLRVSADETMIENPSSDSVWVSYDTTPLEVRGGEYVKLS